MQWRGCEKQMKKPKHMKRTIISALLVVLLCAVGVGYAGFMAQLGYHGTVATAKVEISVVDYSGTWVYKNLLTHERHVLHYEETNSNYMLVSSAYAQSGSGEWDVEFVFDNLFPCVDFVADFVAEYTGTIPVNLVDMTFNIDQWLEPYLVWKAYKCQGSPGAWQIGERIQIGEQLHNGDKIYVVVCIHIPQDNTLQGQVGEFSGSLNILQWQDDCGDKPELVLPDEPVSLTVTHWGANSYFDALLENIPDGLIFDDGTYVGWCVDEYHTINTGTVYPVMLYNALDNTIWPDEDWDLVAYLINHKNPVANKQQIQNAIWHFVDGGYYGSDPVVWGMINEAIIYGEGFVPGVGEWVPVLCDAGDTVQKIFVEIDP